MNFKSIMLNSLLIASSVFGIANTAFAANVTTINGEDGTVYQIDLDDLTEAKTEEGRRHVIFWLSTATDPNKHKAIASCDPYQLKSEDYNLDWLPDSSQSYPEDTVSGAIARTVCGS
jgi:ABC-type Fe3+ transport system substrate-binding protein